MSRDKLDLVNNALTSVEGPSTLTKSLSIPKIKENKRKSLGKKTKGKVCGKKSGKNTADNDFQKMLVKQYKKIL